MPLDIASTPDGWRIEVSREVEAPASIAWRLLTRTRYWPDWGPPVTGVDPPDAEIDAGMEGRIQRVWSVWVPFRIQTCTDRRWTWTVIGRTPSAQGHRVESVGEDRSRIVLEVPLWAPWYVPNCWWALSNLERLCERELDAASDE
jgi:hypothetical protein